MKKTSFSYRFCLSIYVFFKRNFKQIYFLYKKKSKHTDVNYFRKKYRLSILVETGTYHGDMVAAMLSKFKNIYTIELNELFFEKAKKRFSNDSHVSIIKGDSGEKLGLVIKEINKPILFWLDGHYSGGDTSCGEKETPIYKELQVIFRHNIKNHVILIDDARCFNGTCDYPTQKKLAKFVQKESNYQLSISRDIIRLVPIS